MKAIEILPSSCEKCEGKLELCPVYYPWNEEFWICSDCGSTYIKQIETEE